MKKINNTFHLTAYMSVAQYKAFILSSDVVCQQVVIRKREVHKYYKCATFYCLHLSTPYSSVAWGIYHLYSQP